MKNRNIVGDMGGYFSKNPHSIPDTQGKKIHAFSEILVQQDILTFPCPNPPAPSLVL